MDDVEHLKKLILLGRTRNEIMNLMGWSWHRIRRIKERAKKDGRRIPPFEKSRCNKKAVDAS